MSLVLNDKSSDKILESTNDIQGLPIKVTNAPKFVFLNQQPRRAGEKVEDEPEDEFADLYKQMDVNDLTGNEMIYIKRLEQVGVFRKKFTQ